MVEDVEPCWSCGSVGEASGGHASWTSEYIVRPNSLVMEINILYHGGMDRGPRSHGPPTFRVPATVCI